MRYEFDWIDAFTDKTFGGNGCAVVHQGAGLSDATCMAFVRETSLVECTFTGPSDTADFRVRYFLAGGEIPFAGHPTIATVLALRDRGLVGDGDLTLETLAGVLPVSVHGNRVTMRQNAPHFGAKVPANLIAEIGGIAVDDIIAPPQIVSTGLPFCIVLLRDRQAVDRVKLDASALKRLAAYASSSDQPAMEPFWATLGGQTQTGDTFARLLMAPPNPAEDPFTGSATGAMAAYLWHYGLIQTPTFVAEQGHGLNRPGHADVEVHGPPEAITGVNVTGQGVIVMSGTAYLPD